MRRVLAVLLIALMMFSPMLGSIARAQAEKGPASDAIEWKGIGLEQVANAIKSGEIDAYLFGIRPRAAQQLAGQSGIKLYQAPSGLVDIGLNPAPVMIVMLEGQYDKKAAAQAIGIDPVAIEYATYIPENANLTEINNKPFIGIPINKTGVTIVELCAKPTAGVQQGQVIWQSDKMEINPFCFRQIRFALNYLINRDYIVKNIYNGFAIPKYAFYGPDDPTYTELIDIVAKYKFSYNPDYAKAVVSKIFSKLGAEMKGGVWYYNGKPVQVIGIIRQEDERKDIGNMFADALEKTLGIKVNRQLLPFGEAIPKVYFTDPKDFEWGFYTEGWGKGSLDRWDPWMLAQFAAAWLGWAPGWGDTTYWNYRNDTIDMYSKPTALGEVTSKKQFIEYLRKGTELGIQESIRIWIAAVNSIFPARADLEGVTLDLGAGLRNPFFYRGARAPGSNTLKIGHLHVYTASTIWSPIGGFDDVYSVDPARATWDPWVWRHPFNGEPIPFRVSYTVETAGPNGTMQVPDDAIWWDAANDKWVYAKDLGRTTAVSKVVFDLSNLVGSKWHDGQPITCADVLAYWAVWLDLVYDKDKSALESSIAGPSKESFDKIVAIRPLPKEHKLEVYVNYWHFDPNYIADFATLSYYSPAEIMFALDYLAFKAKTYALSDTRSKKENIPQLNLVIESHARDVVKALEEMDFNEYKSYITLPDGTVPVPNGDANAWWQQRVQAVKQWVDEYKNAWISDGPFKLVEFSKDKDMLKLEAFRDPSYPFGPTDWVFGEPTPTRITGVNVPIVEPGRPATITVTATGLPPIHVKFIVRDPVTNQVLYTGEAKPSGGVYVIELPSDVTSKFAEYSAYELDVIAYSEQVALPAEKTVNIQTTARVTGQIQQISGQLQQTQQQVQQLQQQLQSQQQQLQQLQNQLQQQQEQLQQLQQQLQQLGQVLGQQFAQQLQQLVNTISGQINTLSQQVKTLSDTANTIGKQVAALGDAATAIGKQLDNIAAKVDSNSKAIKDLQDAVANLPASVNKQVKSAVDAAKAAKASADSAAGKANLAFIVSLINLLILLAVAGMLFTKRQQ